METITPKSMLISYYGNRLTYIEGEENKICVIDYTVVLGLGLTEETSENFWQGCWKRHLKHLKRLAREEYEREDKTRRINAFGRMFHESREKSFKK